MINKTVNLNEISFDEKSVNEALIDSIRKRGIAIPVRVSINEGKYICIDGHKRLSVCQYLSQEDKKFDRIPIMICNDFSKAGSSFWGNTRNHH